MRLFLVLLAFLLLPAIGNTATIVVPDDEVSIQDAIAAASDGDLILVKPGNYGPIDYQGKELTIRSDIDANPSTIDLAPESTFITGSTWSGVSIVNGAGKTQVLGGFTIRAGTGYALGGSTYGGGIYCFNSEPIIANNIIRFNSADFGGGIYCEDADATLTNNTIELNTADVRAGGIMCWHASPEISFNSISNNTVTANPDSRGGGIEVFEFCTPNITNNIIKGNVAAKGAGIECYSANPIITNNIIKWNDADEGGGLYCYTSAPIVTNNTFFENTAVTHGGGVYCYWNSFPQLTNTILWGDTPTEVDMDVTSTPDIDHCDVQGGWGTGVGNINADPMFLELSPGTNLHLDRSVSPYSPCVDAGDNGAASLPAIDFDGEARIIDGNGDLIDLVDIGVDEFIRYPVGEFHVPSQYASIQEAINHAGSGATILVARDFIHEGPYVENLDFMGKAITVRSDGDANPATHDIAALITTIDGNANGSVATFSNGEGLSSVLEGFTIQNGSGTPDGNYVYGGAIYCNSASPTLISNIIKENTAEFGGAIHCGFASYPIISMNRIESNYAAYDGGAIMCSDSSPTITKNRIKANSAELGGGGISLFHYCFPVIINNFIFQNDAAYGGGVECFWSDPVISFNTILDNTATQSGGGIYFDYNSICTLTNNILWGCNAPQGSALSVMGFSDTDVSYCNVQGGQAACHVDASSTQNWAQGMLDAQPYFQDPANEDYHITITSPCMDGGTDDVTVTEDFEGDPRPLMGGSDIGADEFNGPVSLVTDTYTISQTTGGVANLTLNAGIQYAGYQYYMLGGISGTAPGIDINFLVHLPLNWDFVSQLILNFANSQVFPNFKGILDGSGSATASFDTQGPLPPETVGLTFSFAYILDPQVYASTPVSVEIVP